MFLCQVHLLLNKVRVFPAWTFRFHQPEEAAPKVKTLPSACRRSVLEFHLLKAKVAEGTGTKEREQGCWDAIMVYSLKNSHQRD